jgi:hypothetical protein
MTRIVAVLVVLVLAITTLLVGCGGDERLGCIPGEQRACGCSGGTIGAQTCNAEGAAFDACLGCTIGTIACSAQTACPIGYDCGLATPTATAPTCYARTYDTIAGGYGTSCAIVALDCTAGPSPCAAGFMCDAQTKCDPDAVCTRACALDTDCPPTMRCASDTHRCAMRDACSPCAIDDQCGPDAKCVADPHGERYCAATCAGDIDCLQPFGDERGTPQPFQRCVAGACQPVSGFCHGDGGICAGCRPSESGDCAAGTTCFESYAGERFCTIACTATYHWNGTAYDITDDCPTSSYCSSGAQPCEGPFDCTTTGICTNDPTHRFLTCSP